MVDLPHLVVRAIRAIRGPSPDFFWWSGRGKRVASAKYWRSRLRDVATRAGLADFHTHHLRDTSAPRTGWTRYWRKWIDSALEGELTEIEAES